MFLSNAALERILDAASSGGADFAEVFCEENQRNIIAVRAAGVDNCSQGRESGIGIRVFSGLHCYYAYSNDSREETLLRLTRELTEACKAGTPQRRPLGRLTAYGETCSGGFSDRGSYETKLALIDRAIQAGLAYDSEICQMTVRYLDSDQRVLIANTEGLLATGSCRRQSYRFPPEARMTNTFIAPGQSTRDEIISATEKGLFVGNINGGSVDSVTGDFNFSVTECRLIENGRLTEPVYGATLIGNGGQVLRQVDMVGNNLQLGQGYCYNNSGALFVCAGQPTIRVKNILVGRLE